LSELLKKGKGVPFMKNRVFQVHARELKTNISDSKNQS